MKKVISIILTLVIIITFSFLGSKIIHKERGNKMTVKETRYLPAINFIGLSNQEDNLITLSSDKPVILIYFSPDCEHCQYEATELKGNIEYFDSTEILMVTRADELTTRKFAQDYGLSKYPNVHFLVDPTDQFYKTFGTHFFPSIFIYNKKHKLVKKFIVETKMEAIIKAIGS